MKLKVCGLTSIAQMERAHELGVDYVGLVLYAGSKRSALPFTEAAADELERVGISKIGVYVNEDAAKVMADTERYNLTAVQLHGDESPEYCAGLRDRVNIIKAFRIGADTDIDALVAPYHAVCDYFLFDTRTEDYGGSGRSFDWKLLEKALVDKLFFLSGGIGPDDLEKIRSFYHPFLYCIDINSRFETEPGVKDMAVVATFLSELHASRSGHVQNDH
ncbi:phosphoribosylanthranilate isomerase [Flaviaesturariibacter amylovorans]|uniref:N-(5'-phosphoribosyl)anthranilate isomerase n=1 Tax=Flaviaesturariibacter amylovorans TaxID=1084520 RepID=A0ABP8GEU9_9BACT